jgi:hypothetical protein
MSVSVAAPARAVELSTSARPHEEPPERGVAPSPCCAAGIVPAGHFEVEANYSGDGVRGGFVHTSTLTLKYSLTDHVQLQLATNNLAVGGSGVAARGFDGVSPGLKVVLLDQGELAPQLAVSAHLVFPTLTQDDARQTTVDTLAMLYASKDFGRLHLDVTATLVIADLTGVPVPQGAAALTATWNFNETWAVASGPYSSFGNGDRLALDGGWYAALNWSPVPELVFCGGAEVGLFQDTRSYSVFGGVAWVPTASARLPLAQQAPARKEAPQVAAR